jgi:hypothetical protein
MAMLISNTELILGVRLDASRRASFSRKGRREKAAFLESGGQ